MPHATPLSPSYAPCSTTLTTITLPLVIPGSLCNISLLNTPELGFVDDMVQASSSYARSRCTPKHARHLYQTNRVNAWCKGMCVLCVVCCVLCVVRCLLHVIST